MSELLFNKRKMLQFNSIENNYRFATTNWITIELREEGGFDPFVLMLCILSASFFSRPASQEFLRISRMFYSVAVHQGWIRMEGDSSICRTHLSYPPTEFARFQTDLVPSLAGSRAPIVILMPTNSNRENGQLSLAALYPTPFSGTQSFSENHYWVNIWHILSK